MYAEIFIFKMPKFLVIFFWAPNTVLLLIIIQQESAEAALNIQ